MFLKLRSAVQSRYSDTVDYKQYEAQIQKLIDTHIESGEIKIMTELVNIFDKEKFSEEVEKLTGAAAKADTIASRTAKHINENMDSDPAFYKKFSQLLKDTIEAYERGRISELEYLSRVTEYMNKVLNHMDDTIPTEIQDSHALKAYFGLCMEIFREVMKDNTDIKKPAIETAKKFDEIICQNIVVDWQNNETLIGKIKISMEDYLIDEIKRVYDIPLSFDHIDVLIERCVEVAKLWNK